MATILSYDDILRLEREQQDQRLIAAIKRAVDGETDWESLSYMMGRNERPDLLRFVWWRLPHDQLVVALGDAWTSSEYPEHRMPRQEWLPIFRKAGYHIDDDPATPPENITLWRGGVKKTRMAWTADRERAEWFQYWHEHIGKPGSCGPSLSVPTVCSRTITRSSAAKMSTLSTPPASDPKRFDNEDEPAETAHPITPGWAVSFAYGQIGARTWVTKNDAGLSGPTVVRRRRRHGQRRLLLRT